MSPDPSLLTEDDREDIQALVLFGTKSPHLRYHFYRVEDAEGARRFIAALLKPGPLLVNTAGQTQTSSDRLNLVYVAFTHAGLRSLGLADATLASFPEEFRQGARSRAVGPIGDVTEGSAEKWIVSDDETHLAVLLYSRTLQSSFDRSVDLNKLAGDNGCSLVRYLDAQALPDFDHPNGQRVSFGAHFGFSDGISQPSLVGERRAPSGGPAAIKPGAFVLGHPDPARAETNHPPLNPPELGANGTFAAFRIFEQDCDAFEAFLDRNSTDAASRELLAARLCGRWRNGVSLAVSPDSPGLPVPLSREQLNDFDYVPTASHPLAVDDRRGLRCPIGSHARRSNPRGGDTFGSMGEKIRLIRRGMPYGPPHVRGDGKSRGMLGLFLCASLKHQFEFVMRNWLHDGLFARGLNPAEKDPFVGVSQESDTFSYRTERGQVTVGGLSSFVSTRGGAYLFFPGIRALQMLSAAPEKVVPLAPPAPQPRQPAAAPAAARVEPLREPREDDPPETHIDFVIADIRNRVGSGIHRDAHPKHHGIVKALFQVNGGDDVSLDHRANRDRLAHGVFARPRTYRCYIRFSNGNPVRTTPDGAPDLRGMAIKLFDVEGDKLADERGTQDFILASDPRFFVKNLKQYARFLTSTGPAKIAAFPLLAQVFRSHENPLTIRYFSQTPYKCGPEVVKHCVVPVSPGEEPGTLKLTLDQMVLRGSNYLREAMAEALSRQDVTMRFMVQLKPDGADEDDATVEWLTPFTQVATIVIPCQEFRSALRMAFAENISFNPWHAIKAHAPVGSINLARKRVYEEVARLRRENGGVTFDEPSGTEL
jgi:deferrochelatase/peroxidase EfeB